VTHEVDVVAEVERGGMAVPCRNGRAVPSALVERVLVLARSRESPMGNWSRKELADAFDVYQQQVIDVGRTWDWASYADVFTEDATYVEHALGNMSGRAAIKDWIVSTMNMFPGSEMPSYPVEWCAIDADDDWVIFKNINTMKDPGDGSVHGAPVITALKYAGDGRWSYEEDAYNPMNFMVMIQEYVTRCHQLGTLSDDARTFATNMGWQLA
jgi:ketosteroid isomerase-like protein